MKLKSDKYDTPLDKDLQQLALSNWPAFVEIMGEDAITVAKVRLLHTRGKKMAQIATQYKLRINYDQVRYIIRKFSEKFS